MDIKLIEKLLSSGESQHVEFKTRFVPERDLARVVGAFANSEGGYIFIGVDNNGTVVGINSDKVNIIELDSQINKLISPPAKFESSIHVIKDKTILAIHVEKSPTPHFVSGKFYRRLRESNVIVEDTRLSNGTRVFSENGKTSYIKDFHVPDSPMHPGEERVVRALEIRAHQKTLRITFIWGDNSIKVKGAHMVDENVFEFPASDVTKVWYLKYSVDKDINVQCNKQVYINVEEIVTNTFIVRFYRFLAYILIALSFFPLISSFFKPTLFQLSVGGVFSIPIPFATIVSYLLLQKKIDVAINRLANISLITNSKYNEKAITDPNNIQLKTVQIRHWDYVSGI